MADDFNDAKFLDAVDIIKRLTSLYALPFYRARYETEAQGKKKNIPLSITSVDFPEGTNVEDLFPIEKKLKMFRDNPFIGYCIAAVAIVAFTCCLTTLAIMGINYFKNKDPWNM